MGAAFTAPADRGAGRQAEWRPLSLVEAEHALSDEIGVLLWHVHRLRQALHRHHGAHSPVSPMVDDLEERIQWLDVSVDYVEIHVMPGEGGST